MGLAAPMIIGAGQARAGNAVFMLLGAQTGSGSDRIARDFAACLAEHLSPPDSGTGTGIGSEIGIVNRPGNAGRDMLADLAAAAPTGSTIGWVTTPTLPARAIDRDEPSLIARIRLLGQVEREPIAFVSQADHPAESVQDMIRRASEDADAVPMATSQPGSPPHLAALRLQNLAQTRLNILNFPSPAAARQALVAGTVSAAVLGLSEVIDAILDGSLSALGIAAHRRFVLLPDTPILDEAGIPLKAFIRRGIGVPVETPQASVQRLIDGMQAVASDEAFQEQAQKRGYYAAWADGAAWTKQMQDERASLARLWETDPWIASSNG